MRPIEQADLRAIVALNNAHEQELCATDEQGLTRLLAHAAHARVVGEVGKPAAFLIAFDHATPPQGPNHAWFLARHSRFLYVDRVCVARSARRRGLARALYDDVFVRARVRSLPLVCCEVNLEPPNPDSDAFHAALGFAEVGQAWLPDRGKRVRYLERPTNV
jgi:predicted GNAT superfamily acetyltransferase